MTNRLDSRLPTRIEQFVICVQNSCDPERLGFRILSPINERVDHGDSSVEATRKQSSLPLGVRGSSFTATKAEGCM